MAGVLTSVQGIISSASAIIGVIIVITSPVFAVIFGSGSLALDQALAEERAAAVEVDVARDAAVPVILGRICEEENHLCSSLHLRNSTEDVILSAFELGTRLTMEVVTRDVRGPSDLKLPSPPILENHLMMAIGSNIEGSLQIERAVVDDTLQNCADYFGDKHEYARLVSRLTTAEVTRKALEASPGLVEKPEWWRDWLLGGGMALGGAMVTGAVVGAWLWSRTQA